MKKKDKFGKKILIKDNNNNKKRELIDKPDYLTKKKFSRDIFDYSKKKKEHMEHNNISSSNLKIFKEKEKPILFLKNKSSINNDTLTLLISRNKSLSNHKSNIFNLQNKLGGSKTNKNRLYMINKEREGINLFEKNKEKNNIYKNIGFTKRPISCANKRYEGMMTNIKIERNKKIIRFTKQNKKIYLKTNNEKKDEGKKAKINIENINNLGINLEQNIKKENEESKENNNENKTNKLNILTSSQNNIPSTNNFMTDIFFVKNLGERSNSNKKENNKNICDYIDNNEKNKYVQYYNKQILL